MRAVIYARFSTDLQSVASIEDQARICRERASAYRGGQAAGEAAAACRRRYSAESVCGGVEVNYCDVDRDVLGYVRGLLTAPDALA